MNSSIETMAANGVVGHQHKQDNFTMDVKNAENGMAVVSKNVTVGVPNDCHKAKNGAPSKDQYFVIQIFKNRSLRINKPLIFLKLALFTYFGACSFMPSFITLLFKQRGVSLSELSLMTIFAPIVQFAGTTVSGVIADKIGKSKPVLIGNLILLLSIVLGIFFIPKLSTCPHNQTDIVCDHEQPVIKAACNLSMESFDVHNCAWNCPKNISELCRESFDCENVPEGVEFQSFSASMYLDMSKNYLNASGCSYDISDLRLDNHSFSWCHIHEYENCSISCTSIAEEKCLENAYLNTIFFWMYATLFVLYMTTLSNCFRCFDVAVMFLVKEYDSDFGHERFFGIMGNLLISPLAGFVADMTTQEGHERNYESGLCLFLAMNTFLLIFIYMLEVRVVARGENMWKKSLELAKNPHIVIFYFTILVAGTMWNFSKYFLFWYLSELNAPSILVGLIPSIGALYGLPFLLTSKWWIKKLRSNKIIVLALLSYVVNFIGYSVIKNPWFSLILEATGALTYYIFWVAVIEHSHDIAPAGLGATVIATSGAIHFSIGKATSGLLSKFIMDNFGGKAAFQLGATVSFVTALLYGIYAYIKNKHASKKHNLNTAGDLRDGTKKIEVFTITNQSTNRDGKKNDGLNNEKMRKTK